MSNILGSFSGIQYSNIQNYSLYGVPVFTYGLIGVTTVVLATITLFESTNTEEQSMLSLLPTSTTEENPVVGGSKNKTKCKKIKKNHTRRSKL